MGLIRFGVATGVAALVATVAARAEPIHNPTAIFSGLDKTTGRIINFDVGVGETVQFGALQVTPRVCNTRPRTETPQTTAFVEVDELIVKPSRDFKAEQAAAQMRHDSRRIFSGWMFAASPGLHGVEHPVYDVWLVDCKGGKEAPAATPDQAATPAAPAPAPEATADEQKAGSRKVTPVAPAPVELQPIGPADQPPGGTPPVEGAAPVEGVAPADVAPEEAPAEPPKKKKKKQRSRPADGDAAPAGQGQSSGSGGLLPF